MLKENKDNVNKVNFKNELKENDSFYDITGNMSIWRIHETYKGSGNDNKWEEITQLYGKTNSRN